MNKIFTLLIFFLPKKNQNLLAKDGFFIRKKLFDYSLYFMIFYILMRTKFLQMNFE